MAIEEITYKINQAKSDDIFDHLRNCSASFFPPLHQRVNIDDYTRKIFEKADTFEAWNGNELIGLIAAYCDNVERKRAFITNVSVVEKFSNRGIASELLSMCIDHIEGMRFKEITLKVNRQNEKAVSLYKKHKFQEFGMDNELILMRYKT
jgi:ribosomal protein S18 acetylase RimI-like enzyme